MIVDCKCQECLIDYKFTIIEICAGCLIKKIHSRPKISKWKLLKDFSWFCLIFMPISIIIALEFDGIHQFMFCLGYAAFPIVNSIARWCADKF